MNKPSVDDYLQQGIYGQKELKPEERRRFLGTFRERVVAVLTKRQVRAKTINKEFEKIMRSNLQAHLLLNGHVDYTYLSKYIKKANKLKMPYTIVTNKEFDSDLGLVLAYDHAIDQEKIFIEEAEMPKIKEAKKRKNPFSFFAKIFKR